MRHASFFFACLLLGACATTHAEIDPTHVTISDSSKIASADIISDPDRYPRAVNHLALAEEIYEQKLLQLRERRDSVRQRSRAMQATSYAVFAASTIGVGAIGLASHGDAPGDSLRNAGYVALAGLASGTLLQVLGYMQEDSAAVDAKIQRLQAAHSHMIEALQAISKTPVAAGTPGATLGVESQMANAIEAFLAEAAQINVRG